MNRFLRNRAVALVGALVFGAGAAVSTASPASAAGVPVSATLSPVAGAKSVGLAANIYATFNVNVTGVDGTTFTLVDDATNTPVSATVTYNSTTRRATLDPVSNLAADKVYRATLSDTIKSGSDYLPLTVWTFLTGPAPMDAYRWPSPGATAVEPWTIGQITFTEVVTGVDTTTFTLTNKATGAVVPATVSSSNGRVWRLFPTTQMAEDTWYTIKVTGGSSAIRDLAGNPFASVSWSFLTGLRPLLTTWNIAPNATGVSVGTTLIMGFSETVTGVNTSTFTLTALATGTPVPATVSWSSGLGKWVLTPTAPLASATQYRLALTGGSTAIRDLVGNPLASMAWNFTTA